MYPAKPGPRHNYGGVRRDRGCNSAPVTSSAGVRGQMSFRTGRFISFLIIVGLPGFGASPAIPGIDRFYGVDQNVYRGAQPTDEGFRSLGKLGVKLVLDLREHDARSLSEERVVTAAGMRYVNVPMTGYTPPTPAETDRILKLLE